MSFMYQIVYSNRVCDLITLRKRFVIYVYECILENEEQWKQAQEGNENPAPNQGACGTSAKANRGN